MEIGSGGVSYIGGLINSDEMNAKLSGSEGVKTYDLMRRTDAQVAATINACMLPILGADWGIDRPDDESESAKITDVHLDFARENLFTRIDFSAFLRHACSSLWAGYAWFEKVYAIEDGYWMIAKLSPRLATTLEKWYTDGTGELTGIQQWVYQDNTYTYIDYNRDKIVLFVYGQEANNYQGQSLLRSMYKHWYIKDVLYKIDAIRNERFAIGVPCITLPEDYDDDLYGLAQEIGEKWKGAEQSYVIKVQGMEIEILQVKGGEALNLIPTIQHHNEEIPKVGLAQFINYGMTQTGSRALGESATEFFYDAEQAWADQLCRSIEREIIWPLMDFNFPGKVRPAVVCENLGTISLGELVGTLKDVGERYVKPDLDIENSLRSRLNLPLRVADQKKSIPESPTLHKEVAPETPDADEKILHQHEHGVLLAQQDRNYWRPLRPEEEFIALSKIEDKLDRTRDRIMLVLLGVRDDWAVSLAQQIRENYPGGPKAITKTNIADALLIEPRQQLLALQEDLYKFGQQQVIKELQAQAKKAHIEIQIPPELMRLSRISLRDQTLTSSEVDAVVESRTDILLTSLQRATEETAWTIAIGQYRTRGADDLSDADIEEMLDTIFDRVERDAKLTANMSISEMLNLGRDSGFHAIADEIRIMEYSAIMDGNVCVRCYSLDGEQMAYGSEKYYDLQPPLHSQQYGSCLGNYNCRCIMVGILKTERN